MSEKSEKFLDDIDSDKIEKINDILNMLLENSPHKHSYNIPKVVINRTKDPFGIDNTEEIRCSGAYDFKENIIYISDFLVRKNDYLSNYIQKGTVCSDDFRSTSMHEIFHWQDAETFRKEKGIFRVSSFEDIQLYEKYCQENAKENIDKLSEQGYNFIGCSEYSLMEYVQYNKPDESWAEFRTQIFIEKGVVL